MEPGYLPSSPGAGIGLQTKWRYCDAERLTDLKSAIHKQILEYIPELYLVDMDIYYEKKVLIIKVISKSETYVFGTDSFEELTILDIINFPKNSPLSKQEVINSIQDELSKRISRLEKLEKFPISSSHNVGYKLMKPILSYNNKNLPLQLKVKYSNNDIEKQGIGTSYVVIIWDNTLITLLLKDEDDNASIISSLETHQQRKDRISPSKILTTSDYEFIISPKNDTKIELINPKDLLYKLKTDYRKGGDFEHSQYGKGAIINTSAGSGGKGDSKGKIDWVDVKYPKPFLKGGKFTDIRRFKNIYTLVSPNIAFAIDGAFFTVVVGVSFVVSTILLF
jgi:hypothetical protein